MTDAMGKWERPRLRAVVGSAAVGLSLALVLAFSGLLVPASQRAALGASITVTVLAGEASVRSPGADFVTVPDGAVLQVGHTVRTGPHTRVVLTYFEGSTVEVEPDSELTIEEAAFGDGGATLIRMTQSAGRTWHVVSKLLKAGSRYEVQTPVSTATVRGTAFEVAVERTTGDTRVVTSEGTVGTSDAARTTEVLVTAGLETTVKAHQPPAPPVPAAEPVRRATIRLDSTNSLVVDAFGRANGVKDGKVVLQTPGAKVERGGSGIVVILPDPPEGRLSVIGHEGPRAPAVRVSTRIQARGADPVTVEATVRRGGAPVTVAAIPAAVASTPAVAAPADVTGASAKPVEAASSRATPPDAAKGSAIDARKNATGDAAQSAGGGATSSVGGAANGPSGQDGNKSSTGDAAASRSADAANTGGRGDPSRATRQPAPIAVIASDLSDALLKGKVAVPAAAPGGDASRSVPAGSAGDAKGVSSAKGEVGPGPSGDAAKSVDAGRAPADAKSSGSDARGSADTTKGSDGGAPSRDRSGGAAAESSAAGDSLRIGGDTGRGSARADSPIASERATRAVEVPPVSEKVVQVVRDDADRVREVVDRSRERDKQERDKDMQERDKQGGARGKG